MQDILDAVLNNPIFKESTLLNNIKEVQNLLVVFLSTKNVFYYISRAQMRNMTSDFLRLGNGSIFIHGLFNLQRSKTRLLVLKYKHMKTANTLLDINYLHCGY